MVYTSSPHVSQPTRPTSTTIWFLTSQVTGREMKNIKLKMFTQKMTAAIKRFYFHDSVSFIDSAATRGIWTAWVKPLISPKTHITLLLVTASNLRNKQSLTH